MSPPPMEFHHGLVSAFLLPATGIVVTRFKGAPFFGIERAHAVDLWRVLGMLLGKPGESAERRIAELEETVMVQARALDSMREEINRMIEEASKDIRGSHPSTDPDRHHVETIKSTLMLKGGR